MQTTVETHCAYTQFYLISQKNPLFLVPKNTDDVVTVREESLPLDSGSKDGPLTNVFNGLRSFAKLLLHLANYKKYQY